LSEAIEARKVLEQAYQKQSEAYDKTVLSLSGGALGLSITFIRQIVHGPPNGIVLLALAWTGFAVSILAIFVSMLTSQWAVRKALRQIGEGTGAQRPGGWFAAVTAWLNVVACVSLVFGIGLLVWFSLANLESFGVAVSPD
jgi:hypothetical protein